MASYPSNVVDFGNDRVDGTSVVIASDVNTAYAEIRAIQQTIGAGTSASSPLASTWSGGAGFATSSSWATVHDRIVNIEKGLNTAYTYRVSNAGGSTISSSDAVVGLTIQTSGSGNLLTAGNTEINSAGNIVLIDGGTA